MLKHVFVAVLAAALFSLPVTSGRAQAPTPDAAAAKPTKPRAAAAKPAPTSGGRAAMLERQKKCGAEWREAKAGGKVEKGMTWPKFWSACNKRLKGA
jgi:hypothetical protein